MAHRVEIIATPPPSSLEKTLCKAWARHVLKIRRATVERIRGRRAIPLDPPREIYGQLDAGEDAETFLQELVRDLVQIASDDAEHARVRYRFTIYAEAAPGEDWPEVSHHDDFVEGTDVDVPASREGELIAGMKAQVAWGDKMAGKHLELVDKVNAIAEKLCDLATKLGDQVIKADSHRAEYEFKIFEAKLKAEKEAHEDQMDAQRSQVAWETIRDIGQMAMTNLGTIVRLIELLIAARQGRTPGESTTTPTPPTDEEIDVVLSVDPDLATLAKKIRDETDAHARAALAAALKKRWESVLPEQRMTILAALKDLPEARRTELARWLVGLGVSWS